MYKIRNKRIALIIAVVFALSIMLPIAAFAKVDDYTAFSSTYVFVSTGDGKNAGTVSVSEKEAPDQAPPATAEVVVKMELPSGVKFSETPDATVITGTPGVFTASYDKSYIQLTYATLGAWSAASPVFDFTVAKGKLDIPSDFAGNLNVMVTVTGITGAGTITFTDWHDALTIAKVAAADINVTAADAKTVTMGTGKELAKITIKEGQAGALKDGDTIRFDIMTKGVKFESSLGTLTPSRLDFGTGPLNDDGNRFEITITTESLGLPGTITFVPEVKVDPSVTGDIKIRVSSSNENLSSTTLTVGKVGTVSGEVDKLKDNDTVVYAGSRGTELDVSFEIKPVGSDDFDSGKLITLTLNNGKFVKADMVAEDWTVYNSDKSIYKATPTTGSLKVENLAVKCDNDVPVGDIVLTIGGNAGAEGTVVVGEFAKPFSLSAEKPAILSEALNQKAGDIIITEADAGALTVGKYVYFVLPSGVELKGTPKVEVTEGNIDVSVKVVDKNTIALEIEGESSDASTIRIYNIYYNTGRLALLGDVVLEAGMADADGVMATIANATVGDASTVTATFTLGDAGVTVVNGRTLVQVNLLCDILGLQKSWDAATRTAYFVKDGKVVAFPMGENAIYISGVKVPVDQGGMIINDFTYATLRGIQMAFGGELEWNNDTKTATFTFTK